MDYRPVCPKVASHNKRTSRSRCLHLASDQEAQEEKKENYKFQKYIFFNLELRETEEELPRGKEVEDVINL